MRVVLAKVALRGTINGASETVVGYATNLRRSGHDVSVLLLYPPSRRNPHLRRLERSGVAVVSAAPVDIEGALLAASATRRPMRRVPAIARPPADVAKSLLRAMADRLATVCRRHLRESGAHLVHVVGQDPGAGVLIGAACAVGLPALFQDLGGGTGPSVDAALISTLQRCAAVAALSPLIAARLGDRLPSARGVSVLPILSGPPEGVVSARRSHSQVTFGFAGRLDPEKGAGTMVEALALARAEVPGIRLRVAGEGPEKRRMVVRARELGVADAIERVAVYREPFERTSFMRSIDAFLLPSQTEGTPNSIVEAMAHGLPVLSTPVGGIPDVVTPEEGILTPPGDARGLAHAMASVAGDPSRRARMGRAAVDRYERLFSPSSVMPLLLETYRRVAGDGGPPAAPPGHDWAACDDSR